MERTQNGAIQITPKEVVAARVPRQVNAAFRRGPHQLTKRGAHEFYKAAIEKIEAETEVDDRTDNRGSLDLLARTMSTCRNFSGEIERAFCVVFPEINAVTKPVVVVVAGFKEVIAGQHFLGKLVIATV